MNLEQDKLQQNPVRATIYVLRFNEKKSHGPFDFATVHAEDGGASRSHQQ